MELSNKVKKSISNYLNISDKYVIAIAIYNKGKEEYITLNKDGIVNNANLYFDLGSISKTFTAHLTLKLCDDGLLDLDTSISNYLDLKPGIYPTIRQLLSHQCGYHHLSPVQITVPALLRHSYQKHNIYQNITNDDVIKLIKPKSKKEYAYSYSDFPYAVVACLISKILNRPFGYILQDFITNDLKLLDTKLGYNVTRNINGYIKNKPVEFWKWKSNNPYLSGGGVISNIKDVLNYIKIELQSDKKYIKDAHKKMADKGHIIPCLGWHSYDKSNQLWHVGGVGTFRSSIIINKKSQVGVAVLGNAKGIKNGNIHYIAKQLYSEIKRNKIYLK